MILNRGKWTKHDIKDFNEFLKSNRVEDKIGFSKRVVNTNMEVLGINNPTCKGYAAEIHNGAFIDFLEQNDFKYYESTLVSAYIINYIKDVKEKKKYIDKLYLDNWATVDALKFDVKKQEEEFLHLAEEYIKSKKTFVRRVGVRILFSYTSSDYVDEIFRIIESLYNEKEYYVNMAVAWLICELMIKNRDKAVEFLKNGKINDFVMHKAVSKCRDSFRISEKDKEMLKKMIS